MRIHLVLMAIVLGGVLNCVNIYAKDSSPKELLSGYVAIQEALVADNLVVAQTKAQELKQASLTLNAKEFKDVNVSLTSFIEAKSIKDARKEFKKVSSVFVSWAEKNKDANFEIVFCPMASAKWVQKKGDVANPYYGKDMSSCGEKVL